MKISEVTIDTLKEYARVETTEEDNLFTAILSAVKQYIVTQTGLTIEQCDEKEDLTVALLLLSNDMYENRVYQVKENKANVVIDNILSQYSMNLL